MLYWNAVLETDLQNCGWLLGAPFANYTLWFIASFVSSAFWLPSGRRLPLRETIRQLALLPS
ncbi:hypothetical protein SAMN05444413_111115 [Roseivivax marinus]|nr:hypothetical protein SAMN05444413_111115 [Roseivivax marinus]